MIHSAADFAWRLLSALSYLAAGLGVLLVTLVIGLIIARRIYLLTLPSRRNHPQTELELQVLSDPLIDVKEEFVTIRGRTLFRRIYRHKSAAAAIARDPNAQPIVGVVVFMHGIGSDGVAALRKHVMTLLNHGLAVVSPDFYGHGRSDGVHEFFDPLELVEDLKTHVDQIKAMHMFRELPIFLFGLSIGGHVALRYARKYGSDLAGMTLLSPAVAVAKETVPPKIILYIALTLRWLFPELPLAKFNDSGWNDLAAQSKYKKYPLIYYGRLRIGTGLTIMYSVAELEKQLTEITTPFLVVHGRQDRVCAIEGSLMLYERAAAADKEIIIYEHCNHVLLWEPHGRDQRIMLDVTRWIRRRCAHADRVAHPAHCGCHLKSNVDRAGGGIISDEYEPSDSSPIPHSPSSTGSGSRSRSGSSSSSGACHHDACNTCSPALRRPQSAHPVLIAPVLTNRARNGNTSPSANSSSPLPNPTKMDSEMCACCAPLTCNSVAVCPPFADPPQSHDLAPAC